MNMKKLRLLAFVLLAVAVKSVAQIPFGLTFPSPDNFVMVTTNGVNLRKAPNTTSQRLVFRSGTLVDCYDCEDDLVWTSGPMKRGESPVNPKLLYIRGESGDWWYVKYYKSLYGGMGYSEMAYIMKKFCKKLTPKNLPLSAPSDKNIIVLRSGKYESMCIEWLYGEYDCLILRLGRYINGMYVFAESIEFSKNYQDTNKTQFVVGEDNQNVLSIGAHLFDSAGHLDLNKLAADTATLDYIVSNYTKMQNDYTTYLGFEGYTEWFEWDNQ